MYEELEASFFQVLKEQNLSWFGKLGATGPKDDSLPILDTGSKPYRELLQTSSISIFDFRIYAFARQAQLLGKIGRITEIAKRGQWFVASLARRLRENEVCLISWVGLRADTLIGRLGGTFYRILDLLDVYEHCAELRRMVTDRSAQWRLLGTDSVRKCAVGVTGYCESSGQLA